MAHLVDPRALVPQSVMPSYAVLLETPLEVDSLPGRLAALRDVGVPYSDEQVASAARDAVGQARPDTEGADGVVERYGDATQVRRFDGRDAAVTEMDALVAYLQVLGRLTDVAHETQAALEK